VKKLISVDLPRPRDYRLLSTPRYGDLKEEALDAIHEEALKAFRGRGARAGMMAAATPYGEMAVRDVGKVFGAGARARAVLDGCSFTVTRGRLTVIIGPSGCGKTAIVNLLAGYEAPTHGEVLLDGERVHGPSWTRLVVFQETALFPWMTVLDNVTFGPTVRAVMPSATARAEALRLLEKVGLKDFAHRYPVQLSGGMQRRAELARAIINAPRVMLMDEPFRGLDAITRQLMQEYVLRLFEESGCTSLFRHVGARRSDLPRRSGWSS
jgi:NitT/TauT family transport system ATP-binding protein